MLPLHANQACSYVDRSGKVCLHEPFVPLVEHAQYPWHTSQLLNSALGHERRLESLTHSCRPNYPAQLPAATLIFLPSFTIMADPASIVGTVVGVTSLGIEACRIIHEYYSQYRNYDDDIKQVLEQVQSLEGMLSALHDAKSRIEVDNHEPSSHLHMVLARFDAATKRLDTFATKCGAKSDENGGRSRLQLTKDRLRWPFRKEDLKELRSNVDSLQQTLTLVFNITGIDVVLGDVRTVLLKSDTTIEQNTRIEHRVAGLSVDVLGLYTEMVVMKQQLQSLTLAQQEHISIGSRLLQLEYGSSRNVGHLVSADPSETTRGSRVCDDTAQSESPAMTQPFSKTGMNISQYDCVQSGLARMRPNTRHRRFARDWGCQCRYRKTQTLSRSGQITVLREEEYDHQPECPRSKHADYTRTIAARFTVCNRILRFCAMIGWEESRRAGWYGLRPVLRYRNIVPLDAPAFKLLGDAINVSYGFRTGSVSAPDLLNSILYSLRQMFKEGARPTDINVYGRNLGTIVLDFLAGCCSWGKVQFDTIEVFLKACLQEGLFMQDRDSDGCSLAWPCIQSAMRLPRQCSSFSLTISTAPGHPWVTALLLNHSFPGTVDRVFCMK
ncbi:hypothetical protein T440DRAFT_303333 [Plenodomus tracheiphilus IPT5]|uniref:Azaphilone pigments biosynthesis cluster protein L N-terminal domain-containing protein n=1 Tax=Plenodomus tracheiphilus IPT5 TaxID=1408161 RepID=A0A6A7BG58_9PLEO|nr:hypothetical protein T440DRAFT_303333 [Plenodomus tracheiphilus IPT5]